MNRAASLGPQREELPLNRSLSTIILGLSMLCCVTSAAACKAVRDAEGITVVPPICAPPYATPSYAHPPDDSIAFATLIDGAGHAGAAHRDWADITSGNVCGKEEKELVLMQNAHSTFSIMRGPTPFTVGGFDALSDPHHPWRGVATVNYDKDLFDEVVAIRHVTASGVPDLVVMKVTPGCDTAKAVAGTTIGNPGNSDWLDIAVGDFDGTGKQIALLKSAHSNFFLVRPQGLYVTFISDLDTLPGMPWKQVAAGDLDGDGRDELVVARQVKDGKSPTVLVYKWSAGDFHLFATSGFGNNGNSNWTGMTVGDFNGDKRAVIALNKNEHSNFALLGLVKGSTSLGEIATNDLDSVGGQPWRGVTAVDWLADDDGSAELVAVRSVNANYRADVFVYGDPFHRVQRDSALTKVKAQWDQHLFFGPRNGIVQNWVDSMVDTHTNLLTISLSRRDDYEQLVQTLERTKNLCVDGKHVKVAVSIPPRTDWNTALSPPDAFNCARPTDSDTTPWHEVTTPNAVGEFFGNDTTDLERCADFKEWGRLLGRLARAYPHLVMFELDDFMKDPDKVSGDDLAQIQSNMRSQAPWMSFVPIAYTGNLETRPDVSRMIDTVNFFFRNDAQGSCIGGTCGEHSVVFFQDEAAAVASHLPTGRKLQVGFYFGKFFGNNHDTGEEGTVKYDFDLTRMALQMPELGGVTAYPIQISPLGTLCPASPQDTKYCVLKELYPRF
ncbi:MAG TPA: VCBS repeat-containing protein [Kofleriaceae bacterium]|nr:VCBS repeat-containing protein [Kofleriaceae bacterium]